MNMLSKIEMKATEINLSKIVLGLWRLGDITTSEILKLINFAIENGVSSIDQADIYGGYKSQEYFGRALKKDKTLRKRIEIISKTGIILPGSTFSKTGIGYYNTSEKHITQSVDNTLRDLGTDYIDLLLLHRPDSLLHPEELDMTFQKLKNQGKVLHFGVSNFLPSQFDMLQQNIKTKLVTNQIEFSVLHIDPLFDGTFDNCIKNQISPMIWSPLAGGNLFTKQDEKTIRVRDLLTKISEELGYLTIDKVALAWIMKHPSNPATIVGTLKPDRIKAAVEAAEIELTVEQWYRILIEAQGHPMA